MRRFHPFLRIRRRQQKAAPSFWLIYVLSVIFTFHASIVIYGASTYIEQFARPEVVGSLYTIGSALAILCFLFIARVLRRVGNFYLTIGIAVTEIIALILIGTAFTPGLAIVAFVTFLFVNPLLYFNIDVFSETLIGRDESATGSKRGLALTLMSIASASGPFAMGLLVGEDSQRLELTFYASAAMLLIFVLVLLTNFKRFKDPAYKELKILSALRYFWQVPDLRNSLAANFFLQVFFSWTVIFIPLYLATEVGLSWSAVGTIIAVGLSAYIIIEYPAGILADTYLGEKEMMAVGFVILAVTMSWVSFMKGAPVLSWMILMFMSRVGAALVEVSTESYFFKHTVGSDVNVISYYRLMRPLAIIFGSLLGSACLLFLPFDLIFLVLGAVMVPGAFLASRLRDTK